MPAEPRFAALGVATTLEAAGGTGLLEGSFLRLVPGSRAAGTVRTAVCGPADNLAAHRLLEHVLPGEDRKSTRLNSSHVSESRMPSSA